MYALSVCINFFFFKQKTSYEMRISYWSSDVCSSDLHAFQVRPDYAPASPYEPDVSNHNSNTRQGSTPGRRPARRTVRFALCGRQPRRSPFCCGVRAGCRESGTPCGPEHRESGESGSERTEERRVGKEGVRTCRSRW